MVILKRLACALAILWNIGLPDLLSIVIDNVATYIVVLCIEQISKFLLRGDNIAVACVLKL